MNHRGYTLDRLASQLTLGAEGIFGIPLGVAATFIYVFVLFGAFLEVTGAGKFFIDLAYAATGRQRGGPAKAAVLASAGMGSISGSAIANVVTTGRVHDPADEAPGLPAGAGGRHRGRGLDRRADHAAADGRRRLPDERVHPRSLHPHRDDLDLSGDALFRRGLPAGAYRRGEAGDEGHPGRRVAEGARRAARGLAFPVPAGGADLAAGRGIFADAGRVLRDSRGDRVGGRAGAVGVCARWRRGGGVRGALPARVQADAGGAGAGRAQCGGGVDGLRGGGDHRRRRGADGPGAQVLGDDAGLLAWQPAAGADPGGAGEPGARHGAAGDGGLYRADHPGGSRR